MNIWRTLVGQPLVMRGSAICSDGAVASRGCCETDMLSTWRAGAPDVCCLPTGRLVTDAAMSHGSASHRQAGNAWTRSVFAATRYSQLYTCTQVAATYTCSYYRNIYSVSIRLQQLPLALSTAAGSNTSQ